VEDALSDLGVEILELPLSPSKLYDLTRRDGEGALP